MALSLDTQILACIHFLVPYARCLATQVNQSIIGLDIALILDELKQYYVVVTRRIRIYRVNNTNRVSVPASSSCLLFLKVQAYKTG